MKKLLIFGWLLLANFCLTQLMAQTRLFEASDVFNTQAVAETALSPGSDLIAFTLSVPRPFTDNPGGDYRELHVLNRKTGKTHPVLSGPVGIFSIGWHPSGKTITFRANLPGRAGMQVWQIDPNGGEAHAITRFNGPVYQYEFIDAQSLLITSIDTRTEEREKVNKKGFDYEVFEEEFSHVSLYRYDAQSHEAKKLTHNVTVHDFTLNPDKKHIALVLSDKNLVDDSYMFKRIHLLDMSTGDIKLFVENPGKLGKIVWSPDGKRLAIQSASKLEDSVNGSLFVAEMGADNTFSKLKNFVQGLELSVTDIFWKDNQTLMFVSEEYSEMTLSEQKLNAPARSLIIPKGRAIFYRAHLSGDLLCFAASTPQHPNEVFTYDMKKKTLTRRTQHNAWLKDVQLSPQEVITYTARDGMAIEGILLYPANYKAGTAYPLITYIHGGPEAANQNGWTTNYSTWGQVAAGRGHFLFMPNYRAGSGRGVDFTMEGYGDLLGKEYDDVLDGIDHLIAKGMVDPKRVGIGGGSYGGFFSAWSATKHSERFAAAVVFVGISNQVSKRKTTDIPWEDYYVHWGFWTHENHEKVWNASPVKYAHQSNTPTLILHGKDDPRIHYSQGLELYRALKLHSKAPVRFIIYPGEGHGNRKNINRYDYLIRTMEWFDFYLTGEAHNHKIPEKYPEYSF